jgi:hypothetical protein
VLFLASAAETLCLLGFAVCFILSPHSFPESFSLFVHPKCLVFVQNGYRVTINVESQCLFVMQQTKIFSYWGMSQLREMLYGAGE